MHTSSLLMLDHSLAVGLTANPGKPKRKLPLRDLGWFSA